MAPAEQLVGSKASLPDCGVVPAKGARIVSAVVYTELRVRSSRHHVERAASSASVTPACSRMKETSLASCVSTHRTTSAIGAVVMCRGEEQRSEEFGRRRIPELSIGGGAIGLGRLGQVGGHAKRPGPVTAAGQGRPRARSGPGGSRGIDAPHAPAFVALAPGGAQEIALHAGRHHRALPRQDRRDRERRGLPALRRAHDDDRLGPLGRHQSRAHEAVHRDPGPGGPGGPSPGRAGALAGRGDRPTGRPAPLVAFCATEAVTGALVGDSSEEGAAEGQRENGIGERRHRGQPPPMAASVFTSMRSMWLNRCWTRNEP